MTNHAYILSAVRTPSGNLLGSLSSLSAHDLGAIAIRAALERSGVANKAVKEVIMGCVLQAGQGQAPARQAALSAGLSQSVPCTTLNKMCGSGMRAVMMLADSMMAERMDCGIAGGMESMSNAPYLLPDIRQGKKFGNMRLFDHLFRDGLQDAYKHELMGYYAQETADECGIDRQQMDAFALLSLKRALAVQKNGLDTLEVVPVNVKDKYGDVIQIEHDEQPSKVDLEKIPYLKPAFTKEGTITAANSSSISDGASALVLGSERYVQKTRREPLARIVDYVSYARDPERFTLAPIGAIEALLKRLNWRIDEVDLFEINEAFAVVTLACAQALDISLEKINVTGGACAIGHPIGSSGSRVITTLVHNMRRLSVKKGIAAVCIGGGEATAIALTVD